MKIETINHAFTCFSEIDNGECFIARDCVYMKITQTKFNNRDDNYINAVHLRTGSCTFFEENTEVKKVYAKLVIEE